MIPSRRCTLPGFLTVLLVAVFLTLPAGKAAAQDFDRALQYYRQQEYKKAAEIFNQLRTTEGYLFSAKSYYALGEYEQAQSNLNNIPSDAPLSFYGEALYTSSLIEFQQKDFGRAIVKLYEVKNMDSRSNIGSSAERTYGQILDYLAFEQRMRIMEMDAADEVQYDVLESGLDKLSYSEGRKLYEAFREQAESGPWQAKAEDIERHIQSSSAYRDEYGPPAERLSPPPGTVYNLGIGLPKYEPGAREFSIVKALHFGAVLAAREFNEKNERVKAYVRFSDTGTQEDGVRSMMQQFAERYHGDVVVGPLFSEQARAMIPLANRMKIPVIAPLANSQINAQNSYLFQANPTFRAHGKKMARFAVNELGLKNFAIIADRNTNGAVSAEAFREEAENLGARILHYVAADLQTTAYSISQYTQRFGSKDDPIDAVYAPFTGGSSLTLIDLLIEEMRTRPRSVTLLGSQEWQNLDYKLNKYRNLDIFFSEGTYPTTRDYRLRDFLSEYKLMFNSTGNQYAMIGYDVTTFILENLERVGNPALLRDSISAFPEFKGLVKNIYFDGGNVNEALTILEVTATGDLRVRL